MRRCFNLLLVRWSPDQNPSTEFSGTVYVGNTTDRNRCPGTVYCHARWVPFAWLNTDVPARHTFHHRAICHLPTCRASTIQTGTVFQRKGCVPHSSPCTITSVSWDQPCWTYELSLSFQQRSAQRGVPGSPHSGDSLLQEVSSWRWIYHAAHVFPFTPLVQSRRCVCTFWYLYSARDILSYSVSEILIVELPQHNVMLECGDIWVQIL